MAQRSEIYVCEMCGNIVEVLEGGDGDLVCCGQEMTLKKENSVDAAKEKHVPALTISEKQVSVQIGSTIHPMEEKHYIMWIEMIEGNTVQRKYLKPGEEPKAVFCRNGGPFTVREYCNIHGLWIAEEK